jgi:hypothetical protein
MKLSQKAQREFFKLAGVWLQCRHRNLHSASPKDHMWAFLGEMDYQAEMSLVLSEERGRLLLEIATGPHRTAGFSIGEIATF